MWTESGRAQDAANLLLDLTVLARDIETNGPIFVLVIGYNVHLIAFDEMRNVILSGKLTKSELADLERKLEIVPTLPDPFGKNLLSKQTGSKTKIWSVGTDGKDQGGIGGWNGPDLVLEVSR